MVDMYEEASTTVSCNYDVVENCLSFGSALDKLIERENDESDNNEYGIRIRTWDEGIVIRIQTPDEFSKMTGRYLYKSKGGKNTPWTPNNEFIFNHFWEVVRFVENKQIDKELLKKMTASMYDNNKITKEALNKYDNFMNKSKENNKDNKCAPHCTKRCLNECRKATTNTVKSNNKKDDDFKVRVIIIRNDVKKLADTFDEIIDAMLS